MTQYLNITLPIVLVAMAFLLKVLIDQCATVPLVIRSLYEAPVDVVFLALSFATAFTIASPVNISVGLCHLFVFFLVAIVVVWLWRRSIRLFERDQRSWSAILFVLNGTISTYVMYRSIGLLVTKVTP